MLKSDTLSVSSSSNSRCCVLPHQQVPSTTFHASFGTSTAAEPFNGINGSDTYGHQNSQMNVQMAAAQQMAQAVMAQQLAASVYGSAPHSAYYNGGQQMYALDQTTKKEEPQQQQLYAGPLMQGTFGTATLPATVFGQVQQVAEPAAPVCSLIGAQQMDSMLQPSVAAYFPPPAGACTSSSALLFPYAVPSDFVVPANHLPLGNGFAPVAVPCSSSDLENGGGTNPQWPPTNGKGKHRNGGTNKSAIVTRSGVGTLPLPSFCPRQRHPVGPGTNHVRVRTKDTYRVVYSDLQRLELERAYEERSYITSEKKAELSLQLRLTERQIKIWFQNRRAKERKQKKRYPTVNL